MPKKRTWQTAAELVKSHPGAAQRRHAIILALCHGGTAMVARVGGMPHDPEAAGAFIVKVANRIIEKTEQ